MANQFKDLSLEELKSMQSQLEKHVMRQQSAKKKGALDQIREIVRVHNLTYDDVLPVVRASTVRGKAPAKYRNPANIRQTWSGKGEAPVWFKEHKRPETLRIPGA